MKYSLFCAASSLLLFGAAANADIIYRPINPSFGGDPFNSSHLQGLAGAENQFTKKASASQSQSDADRFVSMLQSQLYASLADKVAQAIFGENAQQTGTVKFDTQEVHFVNTGKSIDITITNFATGEVTNISVPNLTN
jgi:curli production assembly/transport component CsgF